jgi:hypothetical protein
MPLLLNCKALLLRLIRQGQSGFLGLKAWKHTFANQIASLSVRAFVDCDPNHLSIDRHSRSDRLRKDC